MCESLVNLHYSNQTIKKQSKFEWYHASSKSMCPASKWQLVIHIFLAYGDIIQLQMNNTDHQLMSE
jgi:hypothetical protein